MIWNPGRECLSRKEYDAMKLERLKWTVRRAYENVPFYREKFDAIGLKPEHIQTLKDIEKIPYTTKLDLRDNYPFRLFAEPMNKIVRLHASSGYDRKACRVRLYKARYEGLGGKTFPGLRRWRA